MIDKIVDMTVAALLDVILRHCETESVVRCDPEIVLETVPVSEEKKETNSKLSPGQPNKCSLLYCVDTSIYLRVEKFSFLSTFLQRRSTEA